MDFIFVLIGISIHGVFLYKRELLFQKRTFLVLLGIGALCFMLTYVLPESVGRRNMVLMMRFPLLTLIIFFIMKSIYFKMYETDAKDTFWSMDWKLMKDGVFNFLFWFLGLMIPVYLVFFVF